MQCKGLRAPVARRRGDGDGAARAFAHAQTTAQLSTLVVGAVA